MNSPVRIIEIGERPPTGVSSCPFRCMGEDGLGYYVKLGTALPKERIAEWMFGFLAGKMGLPTPAGKLVEVEEELSRSSALDTSEFGHGVGYGSQEIEEGNDLTAIQIDAIPQKTRAETLIFDWWILNEDRKLGSVGGNPNLLMPPNGNLFLIDHGNALDPDFDIKAFFDGHAFSKDRYFWNDIKRQKNWCDRAKKHTSSLKSRWQEIPEGWLEPRPDSTLETITKTLSRAWNKGEEFWQPFTK